MMIHRKTLLAILVIIACGCAKQPPIDNDTMLDGNKIYDPSIAHPEKYLISFQYPDPTPEQKLTPVILAVHGFSATTYDWDEFRHWADSAGGMYVSQILLGGHGRDYETFKKSTWTDWQRPIIDEYRRLDSLGYKKISLLGCSTGCPLILEMICSARISGLVNPAHILMVDPIVVSSNKSLTLIDLAGPAVGYLTNSIDSAEAGHWYQYGPQEAMNQLLDLIDNVRLKLQKGIVLPGASTLKVYKAIHDRSADPVSAVLLYQGIKTSQGGNIEVEMENTDLHIFTRLQGRNSFTAHDKELQVRTFKDFQAIVTH